MANVLSKPSSDIYQTITAKIITAIEAGAGEFKMPWHGGLVTPAFPTNAATSNSYRGVNVVALWVDAAVKGYLWGYWASYRQWQSLGAQVRGGEKGSLIVFYKQVENLEDNTEDGDQSALRFMAKASYVFNVDQIEGWVPPSPAPLNLVEMDEQVAAFIEAVGAKVCHGASTACYRRDIDQIDMPSPGSFIERPGRSAREGYHAVLLHELTHWSGAQSRLDREFGRRFGDRAYAFEELIAELGAAFLCSAFRVTNEPRPDHAAYVASWLTVLSNDRKAIFGAASKAQEAVEYLRDLAALYAGRVH